ncbi:hypothetical protein E1176_12180 [Fulvivirga sp. RKSG066]|uniref:hypothetical protein n=1 Tax=Fulvivirga aurantia TaxID=2529383 RepID=UPI0012BCC11A|nr:hypothetical protein [Fulvivirga aurantia]MTI21780.1 hypothetical protein [Fulvivirga aurantia]
MRWLFLSALICLVNAANGHPSWGITINAQGEIFFTDILHNEGTLWKIDAEGQLSAVITDFHAHDLYQDDKSNLWLAENLWIEGEIEGEGKHTLIKLNTSGEVDTLVSTFDIDLFSGTAFAISPDRKIFFTHNGRIYRYGKDGSELYIDHKFKDVKNILMDEEGVLYITDSKFNNGTLYYKRPNGRLKILAEEIMPKAPKSPLFKEKRLQFLIGLAKDDDGNIYVSENAGCRIIKINKLGEKMVYYQSPSKWAPMNVAFHQGEAFILEAGFNKYNRGPRVIKRSATGAISRVANIETSKIKEDKVSDYDEGQILPMWFYFGLFLLIFALVIILSLRKQHKID